MKKKDMKNSFYVFPFFLLVSCFAIVLAIICLVLLIVLGNLSEESLIMRIFYIIVYTIMFIFFLSSLLFISLFYMLNKIEITQTSIRRKCFGKITKEIAYKDIVDCGSIDANFNFKPIEEGNEKVMMFFAWCYIFDEAKDFKNIEQLRMNRKIICFKLTPKRKETIMLYCPNEELKRKLFENVES